MYNDFLENPSSSTLSIIILVTITIFAILAGLIAIRWIPVPKTTYSSPLFRWNTYRKIPPDQVGYVPVGAILLHLERPACFTLDFEDRLYIGGDLKILVFDSDGEQLGTVSLNENPTCLGIPRPGNLFENHLLVGSMNAVEVYEILPGYKIDPTPIFRWELPGQTPYLRRVLADRDSLILADAGEKGVYRINAKGDIILKIGFAQDEAFDGFPGFNIPALPFLDIIESPTEEIFFITNPGKHRIEAFTKSGGWVPERAWGLYSVYHEGFCGCCNPSGLSCFPDGRFLTSEKYISRVKVYDSSGAFQTVVATPDDLEKPPVTFVNAPLGTKFDYRPETDAAHPIQAAVTSTGRIAVLDPRYCSVRFYQEK